MSSSSQIAGPSSNFKSMLDTALAEYKKKTGNDLLAHWLATELQICDSVDAVLDILRDQAKYFERSGDQRLMRWIDPMVHVLHTFSGTLGDGLSLAFPPAKVIFAGIGVLLAAAKGARASHGAVIDLFERIEGFFKRLEVYTKISLATSMAEVLVKIVIELLSILSIATKEVKRPLAKIFARKLLGRTDIEDALKRLDSLIQEEVQMATAQNLRITTEIKDGADKTGTAMQRMLKYMEKVKGNVEEVKWAQIEQDIRKWFSPPDPYTNYNIACEAQYKGTTAWLFQDKIFKRWMSVGSLLWIYGKPGSGKSILCSAIIKHVMSLRDAGQASLAFFYFDFRDKEKKQDVRNFVTSLLIQLSTYSNPCCMLISNIYSAHGKGTQQPSNGVLTNCLRKMILVTSQQPIYIIVDALDECPNISGIPTPREALLNFLESIVRLGLPNLHICVTSRPEMDIKNVLGPLASAVSLHDQIGQKKDISNYVSNFVSSDRMMGKWRSGEKELVVKVLSEKADGMFRWVFCQLEVLRHCLPASVRQTLDRLPESLDETYVRVLSQIPQANQAHAHRMLQCLLVAVRPLRVEELAELLAFEFDAAQGGIPKYRADWRLDDQTQAVLSTCSSLVTIVSDWGGQVVQFSHFSVKEFLMSDRLASSLGDFSRYQILPGSAHTIFARACLGSLLHLDDHTDKERIKGYHLARYAARHWFDHARFEDVASRVKDGMETLFDSDKPHFAAWIGIYDMDMPGPHEWGYSDWKNSPNRNPLYYSVLCGFYDLVKHLAIKHPQHVNAICGRYRFPLVAALSGDLVEVAELLLGHGANFGVRETTGVSILLKMFAWSQRNLVNVVKFLLKHGMDANTRDDNLRSPLHLTVDNGAEIEVAQILLKHKADVNSQDNSGKTPLHTLSESSVYKRDNVWNHARLLLEHGAEVDRRDNDNQTPLLLAMMRRRFVLAHILLMHGAKANVESKDGKTPLHLLIKNYGYDENDVLNFVLLLLEHGAELDRRDKDSQTPLLLAMGRGWFKLARILLERGADANGEDNNGKTLLHLLVEGRRYKEDVVLRTVPLLLEHGAELDRRDKGNRTPLLLAIGRDWFKLARILLEHGANVSGEDNNGKTLLHLLVEDHKYEENVVVKSVPLLLGYGAELNRRDKGNQTPLFLAMGRGWFKLAQILLERGANISGEDDNGKTLLHLLVEDHKYEENVVVKSVPLLLEHGAELNRRDKDNQTPLFLAMGRGWFKLARILLGHGTDPNGKINNGKTLLHLVARGDYDSEQERIRDAQLLLERGMDPNAQDEGKRTPLHVASYCGRVGMVLALLNAGSNASAKNASGQTPLHLVSQCPISLQGDGVGVVQLLLEHGGDVNALDSDHATALDLALYHGRTEIASLLLQYGDNIDSTMDQHWALGFTMNIITPSTDNLGDIV